MAITTVNAASSAGTKYTYTPQFNRWKGFFDKNGVLRRILLMIADSSTMSFRFKGKNARSAQRKFDKFYGSGKQTSKIIFNTLTLQAMIGGDAFAEKQLWKSDTPNLFILDPNNVTVHVENGKITAYENKQTHKMWTPEEIFHLPNRFVDARPTGQGDIEPIQNLLLDLNQIWDDTSRIFHRYIKPMHIVYLNTDLQSKITSFTNLWNATRETPEQDLIVPQDIVSKIDRVAIPQGASLNPLEQEGRLFLRLLQSYGYPEVGLGSGTANSEEAVRALKDGLRQVIRWRQQFSEEMIECQILKEWYGDEKPKIEFAYTAEPEEEKWNRLSGFFSSVVGSNLTDDIKRPLLVQTLKEMGYNA